MNDITIEHYLRLIKNSSDKERAKDYIEIVQTEINNLYSESVVASNKNTVGSLGTAKRLYREAKRIDMLLDEALVTP
jgi:hypothetical protein